MWIVALLVIVLSPAVAWAQPWAGIITSTRATDWSKTGVSGGIPTATWTQCATAQCNTVLGGNVTAATINAAIASALTTTYVKLPAGNFSMSGSVVINKNNVALRGAGSASTKLTFTNASSSGGVNFMTFAVQMMTSACNIGPSGSAGCGGPQNTATWTAGFAKGTTQITLSSVANLQNGSIIFLDQVDDAVGNGLTDGFPGQGDILWCSQTGTCSGEGGPSFTRGAGGNPPFRVHLEVHQVTNVTGNVVTIDPPIHSPDYRAAQSPGAWWGNISTVVRNSGVEDLTVDFSPISDHIAGIARVNTAGTWIKGVRFLYTGLTNSFVLHSYNINGFRDETRNNYFYGPSGSSGSNITNYGYSCWDCGSMRTENNIFHHQPSPIVPADPEVGSVYGYNYTDDSWFSSTGSQQHNMGDGYNLYEGNNFGQVLADVIHGTHHFLTYYRNHLDAFAHNTGTTFSDAAMIIATHSRFFNIIGNVAGSSIWNTYQTLGGGGGTSIYSLGWQTNCSQCGTVPNNDTNVNRTIMRWGNWDSVTSTDDLGAASTPPGNDRTGVKFTAAEVPSNTVTVPNYFNTVPASQSLPASFYLSAVPAWWGTPYGTPAWPAIGPDVVNGNLNTASSPSGGHANKIPARLCFENAVVDPAYPSSSPRIRLVNATVCYPESSGPILPPAAPSNLTITAQ